MKKTLFFFITLFLCSFIPGCNFDLYDGTRPYDYGDAAWVCEDPPAYFVVDRSKGAYNYPKGKIWWNGEEIPFTFYFRHGTNIVLFDNSDYDFTGICKFYPDKMIVRIDKDQEDTLFNGAVDQLVFVRQEETDKEISYTPDLVSEKVNQANYAYKNIIDIDGGRFAYFKESYLSPRLIIIDGAGNRQEVKDVSSPFKLHGDKVFYIKDHRLYCKNTDGSETVLIAHNVEQFFVSGDNVVYTRKPKSIYKLNKEVFLYSIPDGETNKICNNAAFFYVNGECLYVIEEEDLFDYRIKRFSLEDLSLIDTGALISTDADIDTVMPRGGKTVFGTLPFLLTEYDFATGEYKDHILTENKHVDNIMTFICGDTDIFYTYTVSSADGSVVYGDSGDKSGEENGVWRFDPETGEKEKLTSETFDRLYLFGEDQLFGQRGDDIYKIDINTGTVDKITKEILQA